MPRSTFVGIRCLEYQSRQRANIPLLWSKPYLAQIKAQPKTNVYLSAERQDVWQLVRGQKNVRFMSCGFGLRVKGPEGLRSRTRLSVLRTLDSAQALDHSPAHLIAAPIFLAPLIAFLKTTSIFKAGAVALAFLKTSVVAKFFASAIAYFKSGAVFKTITGAGRVSLAVIGYLRLQGRKLLRWWHGNEYYERRKAEQEARRRSWFFPHFGRTTLIIISLPITLLTFTILASIERTPVWGRLRIIMMSTDEEALLVEEFLKPGSPPGAHLDNTTARDWLAILRAASGEEASPPGTLMGMPVLDPRFDWRVRWVLDVFRQLEDGVKRVNLMTEHVKDGHNVVEIGSTRFAVPPVDYPLTVRPAALRHHGRTEDERVEGPLVTRYGCLVVESPACNAFSLGFGPALQTDPNKNEEAPGVVVVFTGLLDEILRGREERLSERKSELDKSAPAASNALFGVFQQAAAASPRYPNMPVIPTKYETDQLASTLAHELGHLLLSHSLESYSSNNMYQSIGDFATDLIRTALYPFTAVLGPVFNDWFGEQIRINSAFGLRITSSCASRATEIEADLLGLRILLGAGIDPRIALDEWADGGVFDRAEQRERSSPAGNKEEENWLERTGFGSSHPMNEERHRRIREELEKWEELGRIASSGEGGGTKMIEGTQKRTLPVPRDVKQIANAS
ncbi:hypothetical protein ACEPAI_5686 [Sanghuangporus weigelae]